MNEVFRILDNGLSVRADYIHTYCYYFNVK